VQSRGNHPSYQLKLNSPQQISHSSRLPC